MLVCGSCFKTFIKCQYGFPSCRSHRVLGRTALVPYFTLSNRDLEHSEGKIKSPHVITEDVNFPKPRELWGEDLDILSVCLQIPLLFLALFLRKLQWGLNSPWRRVLMALISAWFLSSSATLALASTKLSSNFRTWASAFICSGRMHSVGKWGQAACTRETQARPSLLPPEFP